MYGYGIDVYSEHIWEGKFITDPMTLYSWSNDAITKTYCIIMEPIMIYTKPYMDEIIILMTQWCCYQNILHDNDDNQWRYICNMYGKGNYIYVSMMLYLKCVSPVCDMYVCDSNNDMNTPTMHGMYVIFINVVIIKTYYVITKPIMVYTYQVWERQ